MTDYEKLKSTFDEIGIDYEETKSFDDTDSLFLTFSNATFDFDEKGNYAGIDIE